MGWSQDPGPTFRRGDSPLFLWSVQTKELSIFVDESGDFGEYQSHSPYYVVTMLFHDQSADISKETARLDEQLALLSYANVAVHTEPLIRREEI